MSIQLSPAGQVLLRTVGTAMITGGVLSFAMRTRHSGISAAMLAGGAACLWYSQGSTPGVTADTGEAAASSILPAGTGTLVSSIINGATATAAV